MSAYACEPNRGSEPGVGWHWAVQAAREHEVWVLTWTKFREPIERYVARYNLPHLRFVYFDLPRWARLLAVSERLHYMLWQALVWPLARRLYRHERFDVVHHLTFNSVEMPGFLWTLGAPFVWGPVGGGQTPASALRDYFRSIWPVEVARNLRKRLLGFNPLVRLVARRSAAILVSNQDTRRLLELMATAPLLNETEIAVDLPPISSRRSDPEDGVLNIVWAGRLIARKGPLLALDVAAELKRRGVLFRLRMAGDGPWECLVDREISKRGLTGEVSRAGLLGHAAMASFYADGDVFLFSSLQDTNGSVVLEAMSYGLPVVALDQHGAASLLTDECGVKIPVHSKSQVVRDMAGALEDLAREPGRRRNLGAAARRRVAEGYTWEHKARLLRSLYANAVGAKAIPETRHRAALVAGDS
jgi:glycosyltransferase involved in cell wall biosynthesis